MQQKQQDENQKERRNKGNIPAREPLGERIEEDVEHIVEEAQEEVATAVKPWYQTRKWGFILLTIDAILLALFAFLAIWVAYHPVLAVDVTITRDFQANQSPWLRDTMLAVSYIGNAMALSAGLVVLTAILFWILDLRLEAILIVVVSATSAILNSLIKLIVARPRPSASLVEIIQASSGNSFPSGHVMSYVAFWGLLFSFGIILFRGKHWWRTALLIISALFVVLVGPSRIYLGDHWASDVLGAYLLGFILLAMSLWLYLYLRGRGVLAPRGKRARHFHRKYVRRPE
ncbi:MAG TPA: phosphatase PAP2 family protein [Ktedonobacteraceae bacterium]